MKVISLMVENVKRVRHVVIQPKGWVVKIGGKNGQGKTSLLDSLMYAIEGARAIPENAKRDGEKKGKIAVDFGKFKIVRGLTPKGTTLTIIDETGEVQGAQGFLDKLLGDNTTNAMSFLQKKPADQRKMLADLAGADTSKIDTEIKKVYTERTEVGRDITRLEGQLAGMKYTDNLPTEETAASEIVAKLNNVRAHNQKIEDLKKSKIITSEMIANLSRSIAELTEQRAGLENQNKETDMQLFGEDLISEADLNEQLIKIDVNNKVIRENNERLRVSRELGEKRTIQSEKTAFIDQKESEKTAMIQNAHFPVPGLSLGESDPLYNGRPLANASAAEKILVAIAILSKIIPADGIRTLRVEDGSLLDAESMKKIEDIAEQEKVQVWIETVMNSPIDGDGTEIFLEDGQVKA